MELKLTDKVNQFNAGQKYTQKIKEKAIRKAQVEHIIDSVETGVKNLISTLPKIPGKIKKFIDDKKIQESEEKAILDSYAFFLNFADSTQEQTGIDQNIQNSNLRVIFTNFGPLFIEDLPKDSESQSSRQFIEGIIPIDGLLKYFNGEIISQQKNNIVTINGYNIDPETLKISKLKKTETFNNNKVLFYLKKQEELGKKKAKQSSEQEKQ